MRQRMDPTVPVLVLAVVLVSVVGDGSVPWVPALVLALLLLALVRVLMLVLLLLLVLVGIGVW